MMIATTDEPVYPPVDIVALGKHYTRHVAAMTTTSEQAGLHSKSDIAAQLGWRDQTIATLRANGDLAYQRGRFDLLNEINQLADKFHDNCAYGRPTRHEAVWLAVHELRKPFEAMAIAELTKEKP